MKLYINGRIRNDNEIYLKSYQFMKIFDFLNYSSASFLPLRTNWEKLTQAIRKAHASQHDGCPIEGLP